MINPGKEKNQHFIRQQAVRLQGYLTTAESGSALEREIIENCLRDFIQSLPVADTVEEDKQEALEEKEEPTESVQAQGQLPFDFAPWVPPFRYEQLGTMVVDSKERMIVDVRGWGFLTGKGHAALGLQEHNAEKIQDRIGEHIAKLLNASSTKGTEPAD